MITILNNNKKFALILPNFNLYKKNISIYKFIIIKYLLNINI